MIQKERDKGLGVVNWRLEGLDWRDGIGLTKSDWRWRNVPVGNKRRLVIGKRKERRG